MARLVVHNCFKELRLCAAVAPGAVRHVTTTSALSAGSKYRYDKGQAENNSSYGPLTDLPDYTYLDGRPSELSMRQVVRRKKRIEMASTVATYVAEIMEAKEAHKERVAAKEQQREEIIKNQLKPKV